MIVTPAAMIPLTRSVRTRDSVIQVSSFYLSYIFISTTFIPTLAMLQTIQAFQHHVVRHGIMNNPSVIASTSMNQNCEASSLGFHQQQLLRCLVRGWPRLALFHHVHVHGPCLE